MDCVVLDNEFISQYVNKNVPKSILNTKPIIAGGFAVSIFVALQALLQEKQSEKVILNSVIYEALDIDIWYLQSNDNETAKVLTKEYRREQDKKYIKSQPHLFNDNELVSSTDIAVLNYYDFISQSAFANTFSMISANVRENNLSNQGLKTQVIKTLPKSIYELLDSFDIRTSKAAFYDGKLYLHPDFCSSFLERQVCVSKQFEPNELQALITSNRLIKYDKKLNNAFNKDFFFKTQNNYFEFKLPSDCVTFIINTAIDFLNKQESEDVSQLLKTYTDSCSIYSAFYPEELSEGDLKNNMTAEEYQERYKKILAVKIINSLKYFIKRGYLDKVSVLKFLWVNDKTLQDEINKFLEKQ